MKAFNVFVSVCFGVGAGFCAFGLVQLITGWTLDQGAIDLAVLLFALSYLAAALATVFATRWIYGKLQ